MITGKIGQACQIVGKNENWLKSFSGSHSYYRHCYSCNCLSLMAKASKILFIADQYKNMFLCAHCKSECSTDDINCPACGRQVRNPPSPGTKKKVSPVSVLGLFLIAVLIVAIAVAIFITLSI